MTSVAPLFNQKGINGYDQKVNGIEGLGAFPHNDIGCLIGSSLILLE
jgi:hypothetical protein